MNIEKLKELNDEIIFLDNRGHVGLSQVGHSCHRYLQFVHYWAFNQEISTRVERLFGVGNSTEEVMTRDLLKKGIDVLDQQKAIIGFSGHWKGHIDGIFDDKLVEFKTHNYKSFNDMVKNGVKKSKPVHYAQMIAYMGYLDLEEGLYMAYNKNDSAYYFEKVVFNKEAFEILQEKEREVILAEALLPRIGTNSQTWFECRYCDAKNVCFKKTTASVSCRTCIHVDVLDDGVWQCSKKEYRVTEDMQRLACDDYHLSDMFMDVDQ